jgi:hypothetical protein
VERHNPPGQSKPKGANRMTATVIQEITITSMERQLWAAYLAASFNAQDYEVQHPQEERTPAEQIELSTLQQKAEKADCRYSDYIYRGR